MTDRYQNKYRIASARHPAWDYGRNAAYFITICTKDRVCYLGNIVETSIHGVSNPRMQPSGTGQIAHQYWMEIPNHFPFVKLGNHIIMPNHVHGIVIIDKPDDGIETRLIASLSTQSPTQPETRSSHGGITGDHNPMLHDNLSKIIRWYKGRVSFESRKIHADFAWQPRFHDHIIRNEKSFHTISEYIVDNPLKWREDKFYTS